MFDIITQIEDDAWVSKLPEIGEFVGRIRAAILSCLGGEKVVGEVCCVFSNNDRVAALNETFRKKSGPTNVLSFPVTGSPKGVGMEAMAGDLILALETIEAEAREQGKKFSDHAAHLVVHGTLHLFGFDHENKSDAVQMETKEKRILEMMGIKDPYESDEAHLERTD